MSEAEISLVQLDGFLGVWISQRQHDDDESATDFSPITQSNLFACAHSDVIARRKGSSYQLAGTKAMLEEPRDKSANGDGERYDRE